MTTKHGFRAFLAAAFVAAGCSGKPDTARHEAGRHAEHGEGGMEEGATVPRGPHGGRLFEADDIQLELRIVEDNGPPEFVAYLFDTGRAPLPPTDATLSVALARFGGRHEVVPFRPEGAHLQGEVEVREPHSFRARISLSRGGRQYDWTYEQVEYRVELSPEAVEAGRIETAEVGPRKIDVRVEAPGEIRLNGERVLLVRPRFPGIVRALPFRLGETVEAGDTLAVVQSNESLSDYALTAPMGGTVVSRNVAVGAAVDHESVLYTVADLSTVWVDFAIYPQHVGRVRKGQPARVVAGSGPALDVVGTVGYVGPLLEQDTRVSHGRVVLANSEGRWQPGLYVTVSITVEQAEVPLAIPEEAIVRSPFGPAVFVAVGTSFEMQPVSLGRADGEFIEAVTGLEPGMRIVVRNAFALKAELGKSEATHDH